MARLFSALVSLDLIDTWAETLDWMFDDNKFPKSRRWNIGHVGSFTKKVKRLDNIKKDCIVCGNDASKIYGKINKSKIKARDIFIVMNDNDCFGRNLIRHIRNGIAHGRTKIYKIKNIQYIEIMDFKDNSGDLEKQTAYINIPLSYITKIHDIYINIEKKIIKKK